MGKISKFDLISGRDIPYNYCTLHPPTLESLRDIGEDLYSQYISILSIDLNTFLEKTNCREVFEKISVAKNIELNIFDLLIARYETREILHNALCFFIVEEVVFDDKNNRFVLFDENCQKKGQIDNSNYEDFQYGVLQINHLSGDKPKPIKYKNNKSKSIMEKLTKGREKNKKANKNNENINLSNLIAAISAFHNSYDLINIWSLTVYQLYDQFFRLNSKIQLDIVGTKWAAWGKEDFDFTVWFKDQNSNNKGETL